MRHVLSALVMNQPGVLAHISGMLASRAFNIESLAVGETENSQFSRITFVVAGDDRVLDQVRKQLEKLITVVRVLDFTNEQYVDRDLMLIKVSTEPKAAPIGVVGDTITAVSASPRSQVKELTEIFRGKIVDVSPQHLMIEISGAEEKIQAFIDAMRPFGIIEIVRTGRIAMTRHDSISFNRPEPAPPGDAAAEDKRDAESFTTVG